MTLNGFYEWLNSHRERFDAIPDVLAISPEEHRELEKEINEHLKHYQRRPDWRMSETFLEGVKIVEFEIQRESIADDLNRIDEILFVFGGQR